MLQEHVSGQQASFGFQPGGGTTDMEEWTEAAPFPRAAAGEAGKTQSASAAEGRGYKDVDGLGFRPAGEGYGRLGEMSMSDRSSTHPHELSAPQAHHEGHAGPHNGRSYEPATPPHSGHGAPDVRWQNQHHHHHQQQQQQQQQEGDKGGLKRVQHSAHSALPQPGTMYHGSLLAGLPHYAQTGKLGEGTFGLVVKAVDLREQPPSTIAVKLLPRGDFVRNYKTYVKREILNQSSLRHPLIVSLNEVFLTPSHLAISMEYAAGGDLFNYVLNHKPHKRLTEQQARWIFQQLVIGLDYCHRRGVANRDLKLENLLLDRDGSDGTRPLLKICDFGYSKHEMSSAAKTNVGTPVYMAPEVILGDTKYDAKMADIWSCGVIIYAMLFGKYPFDAKEPRFARKIIAANFTIPEGVPISEECTDLLQRLLVATPAHRMSMEEIKLHPWFTQGLPPGALEMNDFLMNTSYELNEFEENIDAIVDQAQNPGVVEEGLWCCSVAQASA